MVPARICSCCAPSACGDIVPVSYTHLDVYKRQVIVDLAAERGGNCDITEPGKTVVKHGVTIVGTVNLADGVPYHASMMYARNITSFLTHLIKDQKLNLNLEDEIVRETLLTRGGEIVNARIREFFKLPAVAP